VASYTQLRRIDRVTSLRQLGIIAGLLLQSLPVFAGDVITNVMSLVVSYQYQEDSSSAGVLSPIVSYQYFNIIGESGTTNSSPVVSYQFFEWPGDDIVRQLSSPPVSYFYQPGGNAATIGLEGRVTDINGVALNGVTVSAMIYLTPVAQSKTDANGNYQIPALITGVYDVSATDLTHQTSIRALTLNASTADQNFQLRPIPVLPDKVQMARPPLTYSVDAKDSRLLVYNGTIFEPVDKNYVPSPSLITIVLTHGWVPGRPDRSIMDKPFDRWPTNTAAQLISAGINENIARIFAWDWRYAAMDQPPAPSGAVDLTPDQGVALGEALTNALGVNYSQPIHFVGHSLGTLVNAAAVNFLHGDPNGSARRPASSRALTSPVHLTLFDEAQLAEAFGNQILQQSLDTSALDALNSVNAAAPNGQSPLPNDYYWADNYESLVADTLSGAVNIWLQKAPRLESDLGHGYPMDWYGHSITNSTNTKNPLGFQNSFEFSRKNGRDFVKPNNFALGSVYHQIPTESDELALESVTGLHKGLGLLPDVALSDLSVGKQNTINFVGKVEVAFENTAEKAATSVSQAFDYVTDIAARGGQAVVNFFTSSVLKVKLTSGPLAISSDRLAANQPRTLRADTAGNNSGNEAMIWLPIQIPTNSVAMAFDFQISGDPVNDVIVCGIAETNLFTLQAKYVSTNNASSSRLIDVSAWAGTTNDLFFGFMGGTSTNATLQIENIRFYSLSIPQLDIRSSGDIITLNWPLTAGGYVVESTPTLLPPVWEAITNAPAISGEHYSLTNSWTDQSRFFRLRSR
jgi:hypothetical protein